MSESKLGLSPARSQPLWVQTQPGSREQGSPSRAGRTPGLLSASRLSRAGSPRSRRGARTLELRGCLWNPAPLASRAPAEGASETRSAPGPPRNKVTAALGAPARPGECRQDSRAPCHSVASVPSLSVSQKETSLAKRKAAGPL